MAQIYTLAGSQPSISLGAVGAGATTGQLQTLTLNNINGLDGLFGIRNSENVKKYEIIETTEDLLALSCTWYRIRQNKGSSISPLITNMLSNDLFKLVTQEDRDHASVVRDYYSKKFMVMSLKDERLTAFRQDLKDYLVGDPKKFTEKTIPMVYRLPEFHAHDIEFDVIKRDFEKDIPEFSKLTRRTSEKNLTLTPVKSFKKNSKARGKFVEYWLKDTNNRAYRFGLRVDNPLLGLWDNAFNLGSMRIGVTVQASRRDDLEFFNIGSISAD